MLLSIASGNSSLGQETIDICIQNNVRNIILSNFDLYFFNVRPLNEILYEKDQLLDKEGRKKLWDEQITWLKSREKQCVIPEKKFKEDVSGHEKAVKCLEKMYKIRIKILCQEEPNINNSYRCDANKT